MGIYSEYLDQPLAGSVELLAAERKNQLRRISAIRGDRDILVFAADLNKETNLISISYVDILPISDQLANLKGTRLDLILETPGGSGEIAEDIVRLLREKYQDISVIIPGWAKSAGTLIAIAADEILMGTASALGPIDAQLTWQGKRFSADALLEGMNKIKKEVTETGILNKAYIPILQGISPGEIQSAVNALDFSKRLVTDWLALYKFKNWTEHSSTREPVTDDDRKQRAEQIATQLCNHSRWLTHGRSITLEDLRGMRLLVTDYTKEPQLAEAITRYYTLLQMTFSSNLYKIYETLDSQVVKFLTPQMALPQQTLQPANNAIFDLQCGKCKTNSKIQANFGRPQPLEPNCLPFPPDNKFRCPSCGTEHDLSDTRRQLETQTKKRVV